ncbi:KICSTOR subunit 2 isoform X2 [Leptinotarsa decemlineata]|uniref:KICSTOR subunit 2 isoform X2 n=1 Tax=Leptinotarsa decemlineata TaxID=7539 RepID=UPI003D30A8B9
MEFELNNIDTDTRDHNIMEKEDEFLHTYFNQVSQLCYEKAKEHVEKAKEPKGVATPWNTFLHHLQQLIIAEKSYIEIGFLQNKHKSFLRKDNSLRSVYETMRNDFKKLEDNSKPAVGDNRVHRGCINIIQFLNARISLIEIYEKIYGMTSNKHFQYNEIASHIESVIQTHLEGFSDISMTPIKAVFCLEGEILEKLFKALSELQKLQFLSSLTLIHAAHTRLIAWENKIQPREVWKLGIFKNNPVPALFQWIQKLKSAVLSKFSLYFHDILAKQTTSSDMKYLCSKLQQDYYQKMIAFLKKYDASSVILMSDNEVNCDITDYESFPIIVSYPPAILNSHCSATFLGTTWF